MYLYPDTLYAHTFPKSMLKKSYSSLKQIIGEEKGGLISLCIQD